MKRAIALLMLIAMAAQAKPKEIQVPWGQMDRELARSKVIISTVDGKVVEGAYVGIQGDELRVSSKKGEVGVARASIKDLRRVEQSKARGRIIGTISGVLGGMALGAVLAVTFVGDDSGEQGTAIGIWAGTTAGLGTLGYFMGREFDRQATRIVIVP